MAVTMIRKYAKRARTFLKKQEILGPILAELQDYMENIASDSRDFLMSFETGEQGVVKCYYGQPVLINQVRLQVVKALANTDVGTITLKDSAGNTLGSVASYPLSTVVGTELTIIPTTPFAVAAPGYVTLTSAKTTAGGKVQCTIEADANPTLT